MDNTQNMNKVHAFLTHCVF